MGRKLPCIVTNFVTIRPIHQACMRRFGQFTYKYSIHGCYSVDNSSTRTQVRVFHGCNLVDNTSTGAQVWALHGCNLVDDANTDAQIRALHGCNFWLFWTDSKLNGLLLFMNLEQTGGWKCMTQIAKWVLHTMFNRDSLQQKTVKIQLFRE